MKDYVLKNYIGTKSVKAMPATAIEAKQKFNANIPDRVVDANPGKEGYVIDYPDGYRSWCPKKEFEDYYKISETFIDRMKIELEDLTEKICKGTKTLYTPGSIPYGQRHGLREQLKAMREYAEALHYRIFCAEYQDSENLETVLCNGK